MSFLGRVIAICKLEISRVDIISLIPHDTHMRERELDWDMNEERDAYLREMSFAVATNLGSVKNSKPFIFDNGVFRVSISGGS